MDKTESLVKDHLEHRGFKRIVYQPDGNVPPDFLVEDRVAVEVRRLNENEPTSSGGFRGLETMRISTERKLRELLLSLGPAKSGASWFVGCTLRRPIPRWKKVEAELRRQLENFRDNESSQRLSDIKVAGGGLELHIFHKATGPHPTCFLYGGTSDRDIGGFTFGETQKNLRMCVDEKTRKIARVRHRYPEWWLIFVDHIGFGVDACDQQLFREHLGIDHNFDRVILLSPLDVTCAFEVPRKNTAIQS